MARILFTIQGIGQSPAELPITVNPTSVTLDGLQTKTISFDITNILARPVTFTAVEVSITGTGANNVKASVRFDNFTIAPGEVFHNFLDIESKDLVLEGQSFEIKVEAVENTTS
jgi:hypothetical protein